MPSPVVSNVSICKINREAAQTLRQCLPMLLALDTDSSKVGSTTAHKKRLAKLMYLRRNPDTNQTHLLCLIKKNKICSHVSIRTIVRSISYPFLALGLMARISSTS